MGVRVRVCARRVRGRGVVCASLGGYKTPTPVLHCDSELVIELELNSNENGICALKKPSVASLLLPPSSELELRERRES